MWHKTQQSYGLKTQHRKSGTSRSRFQSSESPQIHGLDGLDGHKRLGGTVLSFQRWFNTHLEFQTHLAAWGWTEEDDKIEWLQHETSTMKQYFLHLWLSSSFHEIPHSTIVVCGSLLQWMEVRVILPLQTLRCSITSSLRLTHFDHKSTSFKFAVV